MLALAEDVPEAGRLVLRAGFPPIRLVIRRIAATSLSAALVALLVHADAPWGVLLMSLLFVGLLLAIPPPEIREIVVDGRARELVVRRRGLLCWLPLSTRISLTEPIRFIGGLPAERDGIAEHGLALIAGGDRFDFVVAGVDRRDEIRSLAETLAVRLGSGLDVQRDDLFLYRAELVPGGKPPEVDAQAGGAYRRAPVVERPGVAVEQQPTFEEPKSPPSPFDPKQPGEIEDRIEEFEPERGRYAVRAVISQSSGVVGRWFDDVWSKARVLLVRVGIASLVTSGIGGAISLLVGGELFMGFFMGFVITPIVVGAFVIGLSFAYLQVQLFVGAFYAGFYLLRGFEARRPGRFIDVVPRRWVLDAQAGTLEIRGRILRRTIRLARASRLELAAGAAKTQTLWLRVGFRWVRLVGTRSLTPDDPLASISAFAIALGRSTNLPIRCIP